MTDLEQIKELLLGPHYVGRDGTIEEWLVEAVELLLRLELERQLGDTS